MKIALKRCRFESIASRSRILCSNTTTYVYMYFMCHVKINHSKLSEFNYVTDGHNMWDLSEFTCKSSFTVRKLVLCETLEQSACGSILFHGAIPPPGKNTDFYEGLGDNDTCTNYYFDPVFVINSPFSSTKSTKETAAGETPI